MPEYVELLSSQLVIQHWLTSMQQQSGENPLWQSIYVDTTLPKDSRKQSPPEVRAQDPFQIPMEALAELPLKAWRQFKISRGRDEKKTFIFPPMNLMSNFAFDTPRLAKVHFHPRNIILHFMVEDARPHDLWMRVCTFPATLLVMLILLFSGSDAHSYGQPDLHRRGIQSYLRCG